MRRRVASKLTNSVTLMATRNNIHLVRSNIQSKRGFSNRTDSSFVQDNLFSLPAVFGFLAISFVYMRRKTVVQEIDSNGKLIKVEKRVNWENLKTYILLNFIPYNFISTVWGITHSYTIPSTFIRVKLFDLWTYVFECNESEAEKHYSEYKNLGDFFTRNLKPGVRVLNATPGVLVSPADSTVFHFGSITDRNDWENVKIEQIKGSQYKIGDLLGDFEKYVSENTNTKLNFIVFYLSPGDYHHYHSPEEINFYQRNHFEGRLFPVNLNFVRKVEELYTKNERISLLGKWSEGFFGYVTVGALNVGSMTIDFEPDLVTNAKSKATSLSKTYASPVKVVKGEHMGIFKLGSTVVLVFESLLDFEFVVAKHQKVKVGEQVGFSGKREEKPISKLVPPWPTVTDAK